MCQVGHHHLMFVFHSFKNFFENKKQICVLLFLINGQKKTFGWKMMVAFLDTLRVKSLTLPFSTVFFKKWTFPWWSKTREENFILVPKSKRKSRKKPSKKLEASRNFRVIFSEPFQKKNDQREFVEESELTALFLMFCCYLGTWQQKKT